jgi:hypothetical protein
MPRTRSNRRKRNEKRAKKMRGGGFFEGYVQDKNIITDKSTKQQHIEYGYKQLTLKSIEMLDPPTIDEIPNSIIDWLKTDDRFKNRKKDFIIELNVIDKKNATATAKEIKGRGIRVDDDDLYDRNYVYIGPNTFVFWASNGIQKHPEYYRERYASMQIKGLDRNFSFFAVPAAVASGGKSRRKSNSYRRKSYRLKH